MTAGAGTSRFVRLAGGLYLSQMALGVLGFVIRGRLIVAGDLNQTAANVLAQQTAYRLAIVTDMLTFCAVITLTWVLYQLLEPTQKPIAMLGAFFRIAENAVLAAATTSLLVVLALLRTPTYAMVDASTRMVLARVFMTAQGQGYTLAFIFLGIGSALFARGLWRATLIAGWLGGLGVIGSLGLSAGSLAIILWPEAAGIIQPVSFAPMGVFEVTIGVWFLTRARAQALSDRR